MRQLRTLFYILVLLTIPSVIWAQPAQQQAFLVHDATMDNVVWLLWAILIIQLILSVVMLIHTIQMNRWLRVRHFLFSQQIARNQQFRAKQGKKQPSGSSTKPVQEQQSSADSQSQAQSAEQADTEVEDVKPQESAYAQINQKMADFEKQKSKKRARSTSADQKPRQPEPEEVSTPQRGFDDYGAGEASSEEMPSDDANASRLDLAKAYIEMSEYNRAQQLLNKVLDNTTSAANQAEAQYWLDVVADKMNE